ncbi:hypothetical protein KY358_06015 [Candidatus Woesearchaeota archaeon]|nr:hypothetical protein [Candidatus Woesearchaeota archaeon]
MIRLLIMLLIAVIIASFLFVLLKKVVKMALFAGLVIIVFLVMTSILYPQTNMIQKGKNYILGKSESAIEKGKDKVTSYVILEANQTVNKAKQKVIESLDFG